MVFRKIFDVSNSIIKGLFGHFTGFTGFVHDFIIEDGEVKSKTESDWVGGLQVFGSFISSLVISLKSGFRNFLHLVSFGVFTDITVVITLHFEEEDLAFSGLSLRNQVLINKVDDVLAESVKFLFNLGLVFGDELGLIGVSGSFFNG